VLIDLRVEPVQQRLGPRAVPALLGLPADQGGDQRVLQGGLAGGFPVACVGLEEAARRLPDLLAISAAAEAS
jgi:hypothetical protein